MLTSNLYGTFGVVAIGLEEMFPLFAATAIEYSMEIYFKSFFRTSRGGRRGERWSACYKQLWHLLQNLKNNCLYVQKINDIIMPFKLQAYCT